MTAEIPYVSKVKKNGQRGAEFGPDKSSTNRKFQILSKNRRVDYIGTIVLKLIMDSLEMVTTSAYLVIETLVE